MTYMLRYWSSSPLFASGLDESIQLLNRKMCCMSTLKEMVAFIHHPFWQHAVVNLNHYKHCKLWDLLIMHDIGLDDSGLALSLLPRVDALHSPWWGPLHVLPAFRLNCYTYINCPDHTRWFREGTWGSGAMLARRYLLPAHLLEHDHLMGISPCCYRDSPLAHCVYNWWTED